MRIKTKRCLSSLYTLCIKAWPQNTPIFGSFATNACIINILFWIKQLSSQCISPLTYVGKCLMNILWKCVTSGTKMIEVDRFVVCDSIYSQPMIEISNKSTNTALLHWLYCLFVHSVARKHLHGILFFNALAYLNSYLIVVCHYEEMHQQVSEVWKSSSSESHLFPVDVFLWVCRSVYEGIFFETGAIYYTKIKSVLPCFWYIFISRSIFCPLSIIWTCKFSIRTEQNMML